MPPTNQAFTIGVLRLGLGARNEDFVNRVVPTKTAPLEALIVVSRTFAGDAELLRETFSVEALDGLGKLVSDQFRRGHDPVGPREWGLFLEFIVGQATASPKVKAR